MCAAREWAKYNVRVNTVGFGVVETPMTETIRSEKFADTYLQQIPLGRWAEAGEVARPVCFLLSDARFLRHGPAPVRQRRLHHRRLTGKTDVSQLLSAFRYAALPKATETFRAEVREFLRTSFEPPPPQVRARSWMGFDAEFSRKLAARGWVGVTLPKEYGGASLDAFSRFVLVEELLAAGAPVSAHWIADRQSGPLINKFGTDAQRRFYLPKICRRRGVLLHRHERAQRRLGPRERRLARAASGRRLAIERPQDLDDQRPSLPLHDRAGAHLR